MQCQQSLNWIVSLAVNLSIADTMVSSLNVTFNYVYMLNGHWPFGNIYCKVCSFISIISVCGSVFTLVAISTDRYDQFSLASSDASSEQIEYKGDWKFPYRIHGRFEAIEGLIWLGKLQFALQQKENWISLEFWKLS